MEHIERLFDGISNRYDRFNHLASMGIDRRWRRQAVKSLSGGGMLLDVAVGTGDLAIEVLPKKWWVSTFRMA